MDFDAKLRAFIEKAKADAKDGLSLAEFSALFFAFIELAVSLASELREPGSKKKEFVLHYISQLYDQVAPMVPLPPPLGWPMVRAMIRKPIKELILALADQAIELAYQKLKLQKG